MATARHATLILVAVAAVCGAASAGRGSVQTDTVPLLHGEDMSSVVAHSDGIWLIAVHNDVQCGEPCQIVADTLQAAHTKVGDLVNFATIDVFEMIQGEDGEMVPIKDAFNITTLPSMLLYSYGPKFIDKGLKMDAQTVLALAGQGPKAFLKYIRNFIPSTVDRVKQFGLKKFLTYQDPELPRVLLIHDKKRSPLIFMRLSLQFDRRGVFGEVVAKDVDDEFLGRFGVERDDLPVMLVSPPGEQVDPDAEAFDWEVYDSGENTFAEMSQWLLTKLPEIPVPEVANYGQFETACKDKGGICFIAFMPDDEDERAELLNMYRYVSARAYSHANMVATNQFTLTRFPVHFAWINGDQQRAILSTFGLTSTPGVVGVNPRKKMYSSFLGAFDPDGIHSFVLSMMNGGEQVESYDELPRFVTPVKKEVPKAKKKPKSGSDAPKKKKKGKKTKKKKKAKKTGSEAEL